MKITLAYSMMALLALELVGCRPANSILSPKQLNNGDLKLSADARLCATTLTLKKVEASSEMEMKAATINLQLGVCGTINADGKNKWSALAAGVISQTLQVSDEASLGKSGTAAQFLIDNSGTLFVKEGSSEAVKIGTFAESRLGSLMKAESDVKKFRIVVGDRPYQLGKDPKNSQNMSIWMVR